jgi:hypothetical protein
MKNKYLVWDYKVMETYMPVTHESVGSIPPSLATLIECSSVGRSERTMMVKDTVKE